MRQPPATLTTSGKKINAQPAWTSNLRWPGEWATFGTREDVWLRRGRSGVARMARCCLVERPGRRRLLQARGASPAGGALGFLSVLLPSAANSGGARRTAGGSSTAAAGGGTV